MKIRVLAIIFGFMALLGSTQAFAAKMYSESFSYFDESGNVVGQSIETCSLARRAAGVTSLYWIEQVTLCETRYTVVGTICYYAGGDSVCFPSQVTTTPGDSRYVRSDHLPPGLSLEQACTKIECAAFPFFLPQFSGNTPYDLTNATYPTNYRECDYPNTNDCFSWLM